jgi:hypothetical protein
MSLVRAQVGLLHVAAFDDVVKRMGGVVAYWKLAEDEPPEGQPLPPAKDEQNLIEDIEGTYSGAPTFGVSTIVQNDTGGQCVRFNGTEHVDIEDEPQLKTADGTILIFHQHDSLPQKSTLLAADSNATVGGIGLEVTADGRMRSFLAAPGAPDPDYRILEGPPGDVKLRNAYCSVLRWGPPGGMAHDLFGEGGRIRQLTDPTTAGLTGTSAIRLGAWHTGVSRHRGPIGRIIWLNRRLSDPELDDLFVDEEDLLPRTLWEAQALADKFTVAPGSGITTLAVQANDALLAGDEQTELMPGSFSGNGSIALNADNKRVDYTAPPAEGSASFQYRLEREGSVSTSVIVSIAVAQGATFSGPFSWNSAKSGDLWMDDLGHTVGTQEP